jgi:hypothetical protein
LRPLTTTFQAFASDKGFLEDPDVQAKLASAKKLSDVKVADYDVIFYVGGHGPVVDLATDAINAKFVSEVSSSGDLNPVDLKLAPLVLPNREAHRGCVPWNCVSNFPHQ